MPPELVLTATVRLVPVPTAIVGLVPPEVVPSAIVGPVPPATVGLVLTAIVGLVPRWFYIRKRSASSERFVTECLLFSNYHYLFSILGYSRLCENMP